MNLIISSLVVLSFAMTPASQQPVPVQPDPEGKVTIVGCVVKGDGGHVLSTDAATLPAQATGSSASTVTAASSVAGRVFYWLDDEDEIDDHAGRKVEIVGELEDDIEQGRISVEREEGMVEIEFKADGERKVTLRVPEMPAAVGTSGTVSDREKDYRVVIRRIDVDSVKVLASSCH